MKRFCLIFLVLVFIFTCFPVWADEAIKIYFNGEILKTDQSPVIVNGRVMVPLRAIIEPLDLEPTWDPNKRTISVDNGVIRLYFTIDNNLSLVDNRPVWLDAPAKIVNGSTMVPLRFIAETFNGTANWDPGTRTVTITAEKPKMKEMIITFKKNGIYKGSDGSVYEGEFNTQNGNFEGKGKYTAADGSVYVGDFKDGKYNGMGTYTDSIGNVYEGEFRNSKFNGKGTLYYKGGRKYIGEWKDNLQHGQGTYTNNYGDVYEGEFDNSKFNGHGTMYYENGDKFTGEWQDNLRHGQGTYYGIDGSRSVGTWEKGLKDGSMIYYRSEGDPIHEIWDDGNIVRVEPYIQ